MTPRDPATRLVDATIEEIERSGLARLTVRAVAARAGVNIAAVNYYFRSKEALVAAALEGSIQHVVEDSEPLLARMPEGAEDALTELLAYYLEGSLRFPQIAKAHLHDAFVDDVYEGPFPTRFAPILVRLRGELRSAVPGLTEKEAGARVTAALSAVFFPAFFRGFFAPVDAWRTADDRAVYAREVARRALAPASKAGASRSKRRD